MSYSDRVDVIDLIINVLKEHEGTLDELVGRLEHVNNEIEVSMNESSFYVGKEKDSSTDVLNYRVKELETILEKYRKTLLTVSRHCEKINDTVCLRKITEKILEP